MMDYRYSAGYYPGGYSSSGTGGYDYGRTPDYTERYYIYTSPYTGKSYRLREGERLPDEVEMDRLQGEVHKLEKEAEKLKKEEKKKLDGLIAHYYNEGKSRN